VFFAIKDAIKAYRIENGKDPVFHIDSPATVEAILMACQ
jgi:xanthine dehydrogenase/oxidase